MSELVCWQARRILGVVLFFLAVCAAGAVTNFNVSGFYTINGASNPTLTLQRGTTYTFTFTGISGHPFWIKTNQVAGTVSAYNSGLSANGVQGGTITFNVPTNAPSILFYICQNHSTMTGRINVVNPPAPPVVQIKSIVVSTNVVLKSTGTNTWVIIPEYTSNLVNGTWNPVPAFTNTFSGGTNTTVFNRLEPICGSNVFLRVRQQQN